MSTVDEALRVLEPRFEVLRELGAGATGVALLAVPREPAGAAPVVVKVLLRAIDDLPLRRRFQREVEALERLSHPDAVRCLGWGEAGGLPYLVTEYHPDVRSLTAVLKGGPMAPSAALGAAAVVAETLAECHRAGFVHRDVKPDNVLVRADGRPLLIDFGLVAGELLGATKTATGVILGTPSYLAPEVIRGEAASPASDRYALGCVLVEMLTGRPLFPGPLGRILADKGRPAKLPALPGLPSEVRALLARLVDPDPKARPGDELESLLRAAASACADVGAAAASLASANVPTMVVGRRPAGEVVPPRRRLLAAAAGFALVGAALVGFLRTKPAEFRPETLSFDELGRIGEDSVIADLALSPSCPPSLRGRLWLARHHQRSGRPGAAFDLLVPVLREGGLEGFADPAAVMRLAREVATDEARRERLGELVSGLALGGDGATGTGREALRLFRELPAAYRIDALSRHLTGHAPSATVVAEVRAILAELPPILGPRVDVASQSPETLAGVLGLARAFAGPTDELRSRGLAVAADALRPGRTFRVTLFHPRLLEGLLGALPDSPVLDAYGDFLTAAATADDRIPGGGSVVLARLRSRALARQEARRAGEALYDPVRAPELFRVIRDHDVLRYSHPALLLPPEDAVRWQLASAWMYALEAERSWKLLSPLLEAPFAVPPMAEHLLGLAADLGRRRQLRSGVRQTLARLLEVEAFPERRALLLVALAATHWPLALPGPPSDELLVSVGSAVAADPLLAEVGLLRRLAPTTTGILIWGATSPSRRTPDGDVWAARLSAAVQVLGPLLEGTTLVERWFVLLVGRLGPASGAWTPTAGPVAAATGVDSAEERFLHCLAALRRRDGGGDYLREIAVVARETPDARRAVVDSCMVDEEYLGASEGLERGLDSPVEALATAGVALEHVMTAWWDPPPWRAQLQVRVARTMGDLVRSIRKGNGVAVGKAEERFGETLPTRLLRAYRRLVTTVPSPLHGDTAVQFALWLIDAGEAQEAEALLRRDEPAAWPLHLRWRWHFVLAKALTNQTGRQGEAGRILAGVADLPYAIPGQIHGQEGLLLGASAGQGGAW